MENRPYLKNGKRYGQGYYQSQVESGIRPYGWNENNPSLKLDDFEGHWEPVQSAILATAGFLVSYDSPMAVRLTAMLAHACSERWEWYVDLAQVVSTGRTGRSVHVRRVRVHQAGDLFSRTVHHHTKPERGNRSAPASHYADATLFPAPRAVSKWLWGHSAA